jgi:hypothetical protein
MPAIIDSAPDCIVHLSGSVKGDDADFVLNKAYEKCASIMTFGPGTTYGDGSAGATTDYRILTWLGIIVMVVSIVAWVVAENRRLRGHVARIRARDSVPQP